MLANCFWNSKNSGKFFPRKTFKMNHFEIWFRRHSALINRQTTFTIASDECLEFLCCWHRKGGVWVTNHYVTNHLPQRPSVELDSRLKLEWFIGKPLWKVDLRDVLAGSPCLRRTTKLFNSTKTTKLFRDRFEFKFGWFNLHQQLDKPLK